MIVEIKSRERSLDQNAKLHAMFGDIAASKLLFAGKERSAEEWKVILISGHSIATGGQGEVIAGIEVLRGGTLSNSKRKCKQCGVYFPASEMVKVPAGVFCCIDHATDWAILSRQKAQDKIKRQKACEAKANKKVSRERDLERLKSVQNILFSIRRQTAFNAFIRERDKGNPCISCGKPDNGKHQRHASHYRSVGACSSLRYDERNVNASCSVCNKPLRKRSQLPDMAGAAIGIQVVEWIESQPKSFKWTRGQLEIIEAVYKEKTKQLKKSRA
ncbi:hypothetical protein GH714_044081 [Hevea brasiliensis]|uniref:Uncharacterized protein n=1 Tax=Hevea brasiliensis TaxID=3981 RepID=A0A6A6K1Z5_HEVBR|nr:hypothetical protein GH714_044081 [Hevea brasiliensis]